MRPANQRPLASRRDFITRVLTVAAGVTGSALVASTGSLRPRGVPSVFAQTPSGPPPGGPPGGPGGNEDAALAEPFVGITTNGTVQPGLFSISSTGVSTAPVRRAAE